MRTCPSPVELEAFLEEQLGDRQHLLADHIDTCTRCQAALERLTRDDCRNQVAFVEANALSVPAALRERLRECLSRKGTSSRSYSSSTGPTPPPVIPGYEILGELGQGGTGVVYLARQTVLDRLVALKVLRGGASADLRDRERFRQEAEAVARLRHPHIVHIYDIEEVDGVPYLAMEYVEGGSLASHLRGDPQSFADSARLIEALARTVHYAHEAGIIHRDLKPANVLLSTTSRTNHVASVLHTAQVKVTDFGLAKRIDDPISRTRSGEIVGTPCYMAPEQAAGNVQLGTAVDIYAMGAILYELLTGRPPFKGATVVDTVVQLLHQEPVRPSYLRPELPRDLETICLKCLQKEPSKRYASALALAQDLACFRHGKPIKARPVGPVERAVKWARRHPLPVGLLAGLLFVTVVGFASVIWMWRSAAAAHLSVLEEKWQKELEQEEAEIARAEAARQRRQAQTALYYSRIAQSQLAWRVNDHVTAQLALQACQPTPGQEDRRGWEWYYLRGLYQTDLFTFSHGRLGESGEVAYSPPSANKSRSFVIASILSGSPAQEYPEGELCVWDAKTGESIFARPVSEQMQRLAFSPDGKSLALGGTDGTILVVDAADGSNLLGPITPHSDAICSLAYSPTGDFLVSGSWDRTVKILDARTGKVLQTLQGHEGRVQDVAVSPVGDRIATAGWDRTIRLWDLKTGRLLDTLRAHKSAVFSVAFSPDGLMLISAGRNGTIRLWEVATGRVIQSLTGLAGAILKVAFSPDGRYVAFGGGDRTVRVWTISPAEERLVFRGHAAPVECVHFSPDGQRLVSCSPRDGAVTVWNLTRHPEHSVFANTGSDVEAVAFHADGRRILSLNTQGQLHHWCRHSGELLEELTLPVHPHRIAPATNATFSPTATLVAARTAGGVGRISVWSTENGQELYRLLHPKDVACVCFSQEGDRLATAYIRQELNQAISEIQIHDATTGKPLGKLGSAGRLRDLTFRPGGEWLAYSSANGTVNLIHWPTGTTRSLPGHKGGVLALAFSRKGDLLASAGAEDRVLRIVRLGTGDDPTIKVVQELTAPHLVCELSFSPDARRLAGISLDLVTVWDVEAGLTTLTLRGAPQRHYDTPFNPRVTFSPDGSQLVGTNWNESFSLWEANPVEEEPAEAQRRRREVADARAILWHLQEAERWERLRAPAVAKFHLQWLGDAPLSRPLQIRKQMLLNRVGNAPPAITPR